MDSRNVNEINEMLMLMRLMNVNEIPGKAKSLKTFL